MTVKIINANVFAGLASLPAASVNARLTTLNMRATMREAGISGPGLTKHQQPLGRSPMSESHSNLHRDLRYRGQLPDNSSKATDTIDRPNTNPADTGETPSRIGIETGFSASTSSLKDAEQIAVEAGCTKNNILYWLNRHGIKARTMSEVRSLKHWGQSGKDNPQYGKRGPLSSQWKGGRTPWRQKFYARSEWRQFAAPHVRTRSLLSNVRG